MTREEMINVIAITTEDAWNTYRDDYDVFGREDSLTRCSFERWYTLDCLCCELGIESSDYINECIPAV